MIFISMTCLKCLLFTNSLSSSNLVPLLQKYDHATIKEDTNQQDDNSFYNGDDRSCRTDMVYGIHAGLLMQVILTKHDKNDINDVSCNRKADD